MNSKKEMIKMGTKVGAVLGGIAFVLCGIVPGFYLGSYGILVLMNHLFGGPLEPTVAVRIAIAAGILVGITCIASVAIVAGAIIGAVVGYGTQALTGHTKANAPVTEITAKLEK